MSKPPFRGLRVFRGLTSLLPRRNRSRLSAFSAVKFQAASNLFRGVFDRGFHAFHAWLKRNPCYPCHPWLKSQRLSAFAFSAFSAAKSEVKSLLSCLSSISWFTFRVFSGFRGLTVSFRLTLAKR